MTWVDYTQLRLALGEKDVDLEAFKVDGILPPAFDVDKLEKFNLDQIVWWDEVHKKCHIGNIVKAPTTLSNFQGMNWENMT